MDINAFRNSGADLHVSLLRAWHWWCAELSELVPEGWQKFFRKDDELLRIEWRHGQLFPRYEVGSASEVQGDGSADSPSLSPEEQAESTTNMRRRQVAVGIPMDNLLVRQLHLPSVARRNLKEIVTLEVDRLSPIDPGAIQFDYRVSEHAKSAEQIAVQVRLIRKSLIDEIEACCQACNLKPIELFFTDNQRPTSTQPFILDRPAHWRRQMRKLITPAILLLVVILSLQLAHLLISREQVALDQLNARTNALKATSDTVEALAQRVKASQARFAFLANAKHEPLFVTTLAVVTRYLPTDSWIFELERNAKEIRIRGYSPDASKLISIFENSPEFAHAQFRSPLLQGQTKNLERFDLSFEMEERK